MDQEYNAAVTPRHLIVAVAATLLVTIATLAVFLLYQRSLPAASGRQTPAATAPQRRTAPDVKTAPGITLPSQPSVTVPQVQRRISSTPPVAQVWPPQQLNSESDRRLAEERRRREKDQRDQATIAERLRAQHEREAAQKRQSAGTDTIIPLDTNVMVNVGGSSVSVRVHDNDVTTFDVWINGGHYRELKKNKGISGSGTDETFIYGSGGASLYYVWELSGKLNHCRLRVR